MCVMRKDPGAALVVRFATSLVFWSDARPIRHRAHAYVSLEGALEGPDVPKTGGERCADNRVVMSAHQLHRTAHAEDADPLGERRAHLGMEEGGEVLSLQAGNLRGAVERDGRRYVRGDEPEHRRQARSEERRVGKECRSRWSPYH